MQCSQKTTEIKSLSGQTKTIVYVLEKQWFKIDINQLSDLLKQESYLYWLDLQPVVSAVIHSMLYRSIHKPSYEYSELSEHAETLKFIHGFVNAPEVAIQMNRQLWENVEARIDDLMYDYTDMQINLDSNLSIEETENEYILWKDSTYEEIHNRVHS